MSPRGWCWLAGLGGAIGALVITGAVALTIIFTGLFDASADTPHLPSVAWGTHTAFMNSVRARADAAPPQPLTPTDVLLGMRIYDQRCAACHGGPGVSRADFAAAMTPTPPYLLDSSRRWSTGQLHYVVEHGVKMTGMPAWGEVLSRQDVWRVVAFLKALPALSALDYARMRAANAQAVDCALAYQDLAQGPGRGNSGRGPPPGQGTSADEPVTGPAARKDPPACGARRCAARGSTPHDSRCRRDAAPARSPP